MLITIIVCALCLGFFIWLFFIDDVMFSSVFGKIAAGFTLFPLCLAVGMFIALLSAALISLPTLAMQTIKITEEPIPIYSVQDNIGVSGRFTLGTGTVESDLKYYYIVDTEYGQQVVNTSAKNTYINESNEIPNITVEKTRLKSSFWKFVLLDLHELSSNKYIITVPYNTLMQEYKIDLK